MLFKTEGLYERYEKYITKKKSEGINIKDLTYAITLGDYFDRQEEGVSRLNVDKITVLCTAESELASLLEITSGNTNYTDVDKANIMRLLYSLIASIQTGSIKNLDCGTSEETEKGIEALLDKENDTDKSFPIVDDMLNKASQINKYIAKHIDEIKQKCYDRLKPESIDAAQVLAVLDIIMTVIISLKNNKTDEAITKVKIYEEKEKQGRTKLNYVLHVSSDVYNKLKDKKYVKNLLYENFEGVREQVSDKLSDIEIKDLMMVFHDFVSILSLLA